MTESLAATPIRPHSKSTKRLNNLTLSHFSPNNPKRKEKNVFCVSLGSASTLLPRNINANPANNNDTLFPYISNNKRMWAVLSENEISRTESLNSRPKTNHGSENQNPDLDSVAILKSNHLPKDINSMPHNFEDDNQTYLNHVKLTECEKNSKNKPISVRLFSALTKISPPPTTLPRFLNKRRQQSSKKQQDILNKEKLQQIEMLREMNAAMSNITFLRHHQNRESELMRVDQLIQEYLQQTRKLHKVQSTETSQPSIQQQLKLSSATSSMEHLDDKDAIPPQLSNSEKSKIKPKKKSVGALNNLITVEHHRTQKVADELLSKPKNKILMALRNLAKEDYPKYHQPKREDHKLISVVQISKISSEDLFANIPANKNLKSIVGIANGGKYVSISDPRVITSRQTLMPRSISTGNSTKIPHFEEKLPHILDPNYDEPFNDVLITSPLKMSFRKA